ncbi:hypothetical protein KIN20_014860 [Parelaphostrongylus tenuis]|uniref:Uncharacterized protein n=1 Tax=Parelaphostrongylus tenuis TaxID=148309 RepID=A0AAD5MZJ8_PARTN|nr:hypothetical protein KIN20_014860 [Parelaphostrongylus tenuis]
MRAQPRTKVYTEIARNVALMRLRHRRNGSAHKGYERATRGTREVVWSPDARFATYTVPEIPLKVIQITVKKSFP